MEDMTVRLVRPAVLDEIRAQAEKVGMTKLDDEHWILRNEMSHSRDGDEVAAPFVPLVCHVDGEKGDAEHADERRDGTEHHPPHSDVFVLEGGDAHDGEQDD